MERNVGIIDKSIRLFTGLVLLVAALLAHVDWAVRALFGAVAGILLVTESMEFCPLWKVLGFSTRAKKTVG